MKEFDLRDDVYIKALQLKIPLHLCPLSAFPGDVRLFTGGSHISEAVVTMLADLD